MKRYKLMLQVIFIVGCAVTLSSTQSCYGRQRGHLSGNVTLGFMFSYHGPNASTQECGEDVPDLDSIQLLEAASMILAGNKAIPDVIFGLDSWDTCSSSSSAVASTIAYLTDRINPALDQDKVCSANIFKPGIIASLEYGGQGEAVSRLINEARVPLISFASTQPSLTEDFPYFLRTSPNDEFEAAGIVSLLKIMNWRYVTTINLDTVEDEAALQAFIQAAAKAGICSTSSRQFSLDSSTGDTGRLINNIISNPNANVVIVFASSAGMKKLIAAIARAGDAALALQFVLSHRAVLGIAPNTTGLRGVLGFRIPLPSAEDEFDDYFRRLTPDKVDPVRNPWFGDYWQRKYQCNLDGSAVFTENCTGTHIEMHNRTYKRHPYVSNVIDAVLAYTTAIEAVYHSVCTVMDQSNPCDSLLMVRGQQILSQIQQINFTKENGQHFAFLPTGDIFYSSLELVNYKMDSFQLVPVGHFERGELNLDQHELELWSGQGMTPVQSVCRSPCMDSACSVSTPLTNDTMAYIPGDVILGGLFTVHNWDNSKSACGSLDEPGMKRLEAMLYALDKINNDNTILAGITLGMDGFDTCASPDRAGHQVLQLVSQGQFGQSGSGQRPNADGLLEHVYGIVGPSSDEECQLVNGVLNVYGMPMISYAATSSTLSNAAVYKNFARTVFSDSSSGFALLEAISRRGWKYFQALRSNTASTRLFVSVLQQSGARVGACLTSSQIIPSVDNADQINEVFKTLISRPAAKVVFVIASNADMRAILGQFRQRNLFGQYYLILSSEWSLDPSLQREFADIAPGITFISETKRGYPDFKTYFSRLNPDTNQRNPWFAEYWATTFQCNLPNSPSLYPQNCTGMESLTPDDGTDMRIAETVDAVYAMARAISSLHYRYCPGESHVCPEMTKATGEELFQLLTSRNNYFSSINDDYMVQISAYGDVKPDFEIYNVQSMGNGSLVDVKVGVYRNYMYQAFEENNIKVYTKNGIFYNEITDAQSVCEGPCADCQQIEKVPVAEVAGGDVWIGGLFELHEPEPDQLQCKDKLIPYNVQLLEAFLFATEQVNLDSNILPELKLGAIAFDTCGSADRTHREVLNFVSGTVEYRSGYPQVKASVIGIIGGQTSDTSTTAANVLTPLGINQISYAATTNELSDSSKFPYFLRTVPSDDKQASAIVDLLLAMNWQYVSIVYSDDSYGTDLRNGVTQKLAKTSVCVAMSLTLLASYDDMDYDKIARQLQANPHAKVVLLLTSNMGTRQILEAAERIHVTDRQWIGTDTWGNRDDVIENANVTSRGALILRFQQAPSIPAFKDYFTHLQLYSNRRNPWWETFWEDTFMCHVYGSTRYDVSCPWQPDFESVYKQETEVSYILDAVQLFATGLHNAMVEQCPGITRYICNELATQPAILHRHIQEANITRSDGTVFKLDANGDGEPRYDVLNIQVNGTEASNSYVKVGSWISGRLNLDSALSSVSSMCIGRCAECYMGTEQHNFVHIPGPLQILGLFAMHANGDHVVECGELRDVGIVHLEAMLFAIDKINADPSILNGATLGATAFDTCTRGSRGVHDLLSVFSGSSPSDQNSAQQTWSLIGGVIGGETDDVTLATASLAKQYKYAQISYGVGTTDENLSNLLRMGPSVDNQVLAIIQLLQRFQWQYVAVVSSPSAYRVQQRDTFIKAATDHRICIGTQEEITTQSSMPALLQTIQETVDQNVVILFTDEEETLHLMQAVGMRNDSTHFTWVIAFNERTEDEFSGNSNLLGAFLINSGPKVVSQFEDYFASLTASSNQRNPWFREFISRAYHCSADGASNSSSECSGLENAPLQVAREQSALSAYVVNAVYAIAHGVQDLLGQYCGGTPGLCAAFVGLKADELQQAIKNTTFTGLDGSTVIFDRGISQQPFTIWNNKDMNGSNQFVKVGSWMSGNTSIQTSQVSLYNLQGQLSTTPVPSQCQADDQCSSRCPVVMRPVPTTTTASPSPTNPPGPAATTAEAESTAPPPTTNTSGSNMQLVSISNLKSAWFVILIIIGVIGILFAIAMIIMFLLHWKHPVAQAMSPFLCVMLLIGVILVYLLIPIFAAPPTLLSCALQRVWPGVAFAFCHVAILLMAVRLHRMSKQVHPISGGMPSFINTPSQAVLFVMLMALEVVIVVEWLILLQPSEVVPGGTAEGLNGSSGLRAVCAFGGSTLSSLTYVYVLVVIALITTIPAWRKKDMISRMELMTLTLVIVGNMILLIIWVLIELLAPQTYRQPGVAIIATIKATLILVFTMPRAKALTLKQDPFMDTASMKSGEYGDGVTRIRTSIDITEFPGVTDDMEDDMEDDISVSSSQIKLTGAMVTSRI